MPRPIDSLRVVPFERKVYIYFAQQRLIVSDFYIGL